MRISHECLYQWIYAKPQRAWTCASTWRAAETPDEEKGQEGERAAHPDARAITDRPEAVGSRKGFGHFESDTVVGAAPSRRCMNTQVERRSRRLFARLVDDKARPPRPGPNTRSSGHAAGRARRPHVGQRHGGEPDMLVDEALGMLTYFADPYSSWQRGSNENRNGRIRRLPAQRNQFRGSHAGRPRRDRRGDQRHPDEAPRYPVE